MREPSEIKINEYTLEEILERHLHWINKDCEGWEYMRADLCNADLRNVNLSNANLSSATLCNVNLRYADLHNANLRYANLFRADLCNTELCGADLQDVSLYDANLRNASLRNANLFHADLRYANLRNVDLSYANLYSVDLRFANLYNANLYSVDLCNTDLDNAILIDANLRNTENIPYIPLACPSEGSFTAWKKVENYLVKLEIPESAKRSSGASNKCRASEAKVLGIYTIDWDTLDVKETDLKNILNTSTTKKPELDYIVGETVYPDSFDENRWNECSHGIHFFVDKQDAINY